MVVFELPYRAAGNVKPTPRTDLKLLASGGDVDDQRKDAKRQIDELGFTVRSLSLTTKGEIVVYMFPQQNATRRKRTVPESAWAKR